MGVWEFEVYLHAFLTQAGDGESGQLHAPSALSPNTNLDTHSTGCKASSRVGLNGLGENSFVLTGKIAAISRSSY